MNIDKNVNKYVYAAAKSLQSCPTLCNPIDGSPPGSPVPGILQARTLEWVAISFSNAWKWKVKVKSFSHVRRFATSWTAATTRLLRPWDFPGKSTGVGCHRLLQNMCIVGLVYMLPTERAWDQWYYSNKEHTQYPDLHLLNSVLQKWKQRGLADIRTRAEKI